MRIFITGVAGFLGSHLADAMLALGHTVIGCDNLVGGDEDNVPSGVEFYNHDCRVQHQMLKLSRKCDVVYHCAALAHEGLSIFSPSLIVDNIVGASASVFSAAIANKVARIVFCSSMARYGNGVPPFKETQPTNPIDPYGIAKVAAENILKSLSAVHGFEYVIAVPHNIIGPRQKYDDPYRNVASIMINRILQGNPPIVYGDGQQRRCFSDIRDVLPCLVRMLSGCQTRNRTFNIGPDEQVITIQELAIIIAGILNYQGTLRHVHSRPAEVRYAYCSSALARTLLGYETKISLSDSITYLAEDIRTKGPRPFIYHLPLEIQNEHTPATWLDQLM